MTTSMLSSCFVMTVTGTVIAPDSLKASAWRSGCWSIFTSSYEWPLTPKYFFTMPQYAQVFRVKIVMFLTMNPPPAVLCRVCLPSHVCIFSIDSVSGIIKHAIYCAFYRKWPDLLLLDTKELDLEYQVGVGRN